MSSDFEAVIGLEIHAQLATDSKIFCGCRARLPGGQSVADTEPNSNTCPICVGHPGTLPVLNRKVVEYAIRAGLATRCSISPRSVFARKNYFYPDLPKGYQISQYEKPICENGSLALEGGKTIRIQRIHMEEDAGKSVHLAGCSVVNLNRAGVPLIEIVSGPDMNTAAEAGAYMRAMHAIVVYLGICDGNLQEGNFRCDANVSIRPRGESRLGTRVEIKNVNSFRFLEKAIDYEIARQIEMVKAGKRIVQETRTFDSSRGVTVSMRSKEEAEDYRYFPDPDLVPVRANEAWVEEIRRSLPELPEQKKARYMDAFGLGSQDAGVLTASPSMAAYFEETVVALKPAGLDAATAAKSAANWIAGEVARLANEDGIELGQARLRPAHIAEIVKLAQGQVVSSTGAKQVIATAWKTGEPVDAIVEREGLRQVSDTGALEPVIDRIFAANPAQLAELRSGKEKLLGFFVGQVMKQTGGKANPSLVQELIRKRL